MTNPLNLTPTFVSSDANEWGDLILRSEQDLVIHGVPFHFQAYLCSADPDGVVQAELSLFQNVVEAYVLLNDASPQLVTIPGFTGQYLVLAYPHGS